MNVAQIALLCFVLFLVFVLPVVAALAWSSPSGGCRSLPSRSRESLELTVLQFSRSGHAEMRRLFRAAVRAAQSGITIGEGVTQRR